MSHVHGEVMNVFSFHGLHTNCNLTLTVAILLLRTIKFLITVIASIGHCGQLPYPSLNSKTAGI